MYSEGEGHKRNGNCMLAKGIRRWLIFPQEWLGENIYAVHYNDQDWVYRLHFRPKLKMLL